MADQRLLLRSRTVPHLMAITLGLAGCVGVAFWAKNLVEAQALTEVDLVLTQTGLDWAEVEVDGLSVLLTGTAPDEATRFTALSAAGRVVDASRIIDGMDVTAAEAIRAPDFSIEMLKNEDGVSLIGLVPLASDPESIIERVSDNADDAPISDLLETAEFDPPEGWEKALTFAIKALGVLPRSKVSITARQVSITAVAADIEDKRRIEAELNQTAPAGLRLVLKISAPRPVVAPFTLRFLADQEGARFDACTADSDVARQAILAAAAEAGLKERANCILGLGTPSTRWGEAAVAGINAVRELGAGTVTISNADVSLLAREGTAATQFDRVAADLEAALPPVFSLSAVLPEPPEATNEGRAQPPEFTAIRSPEGQVQLRGRLRDAKARAAVESFAAAHFGSDRIYLATRLDSDLPAGWPTRVFAALEAMQFLHNGIATVTAEDITISGATGTEGAQSEMARILSDRLDDGAAYALDVTYSEALDPIAALPTPEECIDLLNDAGNRQKITFAPSSTDFEDDAVQTIDAVAEILRECQGIRIEIGGHTDSQGRETMNEQLSQARADAVLNAIMARRVLVSNLSAKGYGESRPIADNGTEAGREANRRIEFRLVDEIETPDESDAEGAEASEGESTE